MASAAQSLRLVCRSCRSQRPATRQLGAKVFVAWKSVSGGGGAVKDSQVKLEDNRKPSPFDHWEAEDREEFEKYRFKDPSEIARSLFTEDLEGPVDRNSLNSLPWRRNIDDVKYKEKRDNVRNFMRPYNRVVKPARGVFWDEDEWDPDLITNNDKDEFDENDMTDIAHAKLEEHREQREYARIAVWEMPLLANLAKPFEPPSTNTPLRFRFTTYMGEYHPAEKKVVVEFSPEDFGLTEQQQLKLVKLAGVRYNPEKKIVKISCESFEHQAQNKRYLAEQVEKLLDEARDPTDTFEDIPLDFRHHKFKVKPKFPLEWRMSDGRMKEIMEYREETARLEEAKKAEGKLIDGAQVIEKALRVKSAALAAVPAPVLLAGSRAKRNERPTFSSSRR